MINGEEKYSHHVVKVDQADQKTHSLGQSGLIWSKQIDNFADTASEDADFRRSPTTTQ